MNPMQALLGFHLRKLLASILGTWRSIGRLHPTSRDRMIQLTMHPEISPELLLRAYAVGLFPMSESADDPGLFWVDPERRGIIPLDGFHLPKRLARTLKQDRFEVRVDTAFDAVIAACAEARARSSRRPGSTGASGNFMPNCSG